MRRGRAPTQYDLGRDAGKWGKPVLWDGSDECPVPSGSAVSCWTGWYWVCYPKHPEKVDWSTVWAYRLRPRSKGSASFTAPFDETRLRQIIREEIESVLLSMLGRQ